jgi:DNA-damage-inducible protein J
MLVGGLMSKNKNATLQIRVRSDLKQSVESILNELGLTPSQAVTLFFNQIVIKKEIPFKISLHEPNEQLLASMKEIDEMIANKDYSKAMTKDELYKELGL